MPSPDFGNCNSQQLDEKSNESDCSKSEDATIEKSPQLIKCK